MCNCFQLILGNVVIWSVFNFTLSFNYSTAEEKMSTFIVLCIYNINWSPYIVLFLVVIILRITQVCLVSDQSNVYSRFAQTLNKTNQVLTLIYICSGVQLFVIVHVFNQNRILQLITRCAFMQLVNFHRKSEPSSLCGLCSGGQWGWEGQGSVQETPYTPRLHGAAGFVHRGIIMLEPGLCLWSCNTTEFREEPRRGVMVRCPGTFSALSALRLTSVSQLLAKYLSAV